MPTIDLHGLSHRDAAIKVSSICEKILKSEDPDIHLPFSIITGRSGGMGEITRSVLGRYGFQESEIPYHYNSGVVIVNGIDRSKKPSPLSMIVNKETGQPIDREFFDKAGILTWKSQFNVEFALMDSIRWETLRRMRVWGPHHDVDGNILQAGMMVHIHPVLISELDDDIEVNWDLHNGSPAEYTHCVEENRHEPDEDGLWDWIESTEYIPLKGTDHPFLIIGQMNPDSEAPPIQANGPDGSITIHDGSFGYQLAQPVGSTIKVWIKPHHLRKIEGK